MDINQLPVFEFTIDETKHRNRGRKDNVLAPSWKDPHQGLSGSVLKAGIREVPGSIPGHTC